MKDSYFGLSKTALTICVGVPCIIVLIAFLNTGKLDILAIGPGFIIMAGFAKVVNLIISKIRKAKGNQKSGD